MVFEEDWKLISTIEGTCGVYLTMLSEMHVSNVHIEQNKIKFKVCISKN